MSDCLNSKSAKILLYDYQHLQTKEIDSLIVHCPTLDDFVVSLTKFDAFITIVACNSNKLNEITPYLNTASIDTVYILNASGKLDGAIAPWWNKVTVVYNENQLMRHLCTKSMLCYFNEGLEHRKNGNCGLANSCMLDSLRALDYSAKFI